MRRWAWPTMGSYASLAVVGVDGVRGCAQGAGAPPSYDLHGAVAKVRAWLDTVEAALSPYRADSDLCRWRTGKLPRVACSPLLGEVIDAVGSLEDLTDGGFRPYDRQGRFDPTGYVKGWAVERAVAILTDAGITDASFGVGGDIQMVGRPDTGRPWRVAITDPADERRVAAVVEAPSDGRPFAVATSGAAQRGDHIWATPGWHPRGAPSGDLLASITVVGPDLGRVDAFATAIWALAQDRPLVEAWQCLPEGSHAAMAVLSSGAIHRSSGMDSYVVRAAA